MKRIFVLCAGFLAGTLAFSGVSRAQGLDYVPNEVLVQFRETATEADKMQVLARTAGVKEIIHTSAMAQDRARGLVVAFTMRPVPQAIQLLRQHPAVEFAEPNWIVGHYATSNDTYYISGQLWGMYGDASTPANAFGSQAAEAWAADHTGSNSVVVGIIDEGIQLTHPDLKANIWTNPYDTPDGIDNDGNGYVDDVNGWDFDGNNNTIYDGGSKGTVDSHGTHVAGTIGATGGNGIGVAGINWNVTMISAKFLGRRGGTIANAVKAVDYITDLKTRHGMNIVATNNSWGGGGYSQALFDAIARADAANILFIAAAGNGGRDGVSDNNDNPKTPSYPSNYPNANVIAVAAITSSGGLASFSNYGKTTVDIGAPGVGIISTTAYNTYSSYSGTSMATPHVTGAAALYASTHTGASAADIKAAILNSAVPTASLAGITVTGGRLNVSGF